MNQSQTELQWGPLQGFEVRVPFRVGLFNEATDYYTVIIEPTRLYEDQKHGNYIVKVLKGETNCYMITEGFPRYYYDLDRAKAEAQDWINSLYECREALKPEGALPDWME